MNLTFEVGDRVKLKGDDRRLRIVEPVKDGMARCVWYDDHQLKTSHFNISDFERDESKPIEVQIDI